MKNLVKISIFAIALGFFASCSETPEATTTETTTTTSIPLLLIQHNGRVDSNSNSNSKGNNKRERSDKMVSGFGVKKITTTIIDYFSIFLLFKVCSVLILLLK